MWHKLLVWLGIRPKPRSTDQTMTLSPSIRFDEEQKRSTALKPKRMNSRSRKELK